MKSEKAQILNFPVSAKHLLLEDNGEDYLKCVVRKKNILATPEEWVRQNMLLFLVEYLGYPLGLISVEKSLKINGLSKRWDILVYNRQGSVFMLAELKAPEIKLNQSHAEQLLRYHSVINAPYLCLSNGLQHLLMLYKDGGVKVITAFPEFPKS